MNKLRVCIDSTKKLESKDPPASPLMTHSRREIVPIFSPPPVIVAPPPGREPNPALTNTQSSSIESSEDYDYASSIRITDQADPSLTKLSNQTLTSPNGTTTRLGKLKAKGASFRHSANAPLARILNSVARTQTHANLLIQESNEDSECTAAVQMTQTDFSDELKRDLSSLSSKRSKTRFGRTAKETLNSQAFSNRLLTLISPRIEKQEATDLARTRYSKLSQWKTTQRNRKLKLEQQTQRKSHNLSESQPRKFRQDKVNQTVSINVETKDVNGPITVCANGYAAYKRAYMNHANESMIIRSMRNSTEFKAGSGSTSSPRHARSPLVPHHKVRKGVGYLNSP